MTDADPELAKAAKNYLSESGYTPGGVIREVDYATQSGGLDPSSQGIKIVDCDTHITEPPDLFTVARAGHVQGQGASREARRRRRRPLVSSAIATSARSAATSSAPTTTSCSAGWPSPSSTKAIPAAT